MNLSEALKVTLDAGASDVYIIAGLPLTFEVNGRQRRMDAAALMPADTKEIVEQIYQLAGRDMRIFTESRNHDDDFSFAIPGIGRFRANIFRQRGSYGSVIRVIPFGLPQPEDFEIPQEVLACANYQKGLVLVTGPAGVGKSTTLACIIDKLNHQRTGHILSLIHI